MFALCEMFLYNIQSIILRVGEPFVLVVNFLIINSVTHIQLLVSIHLILIIIVDVEIGIEGFYPIIPLIWTIIRKGESKDFLILTLKTAPRLPLLYCTIATLCDVVCFVVVFSQVFSVESCYFCQPIIT